MLEAASLLELELETASGNMLESWPGKNDFSGHRVLRVSELVRIGTSSFIMGILSLESALLS